MQARQGPLALGCQHHQKRDGGLVASLKKQLLSRIALPSAGAIQGGNQPGRIEIAARITTDPHDLVPVALQ